MVSIGLFISDKYVLHFQIPRELPKAVYNANLNISIPQGLTGNKFIQLASGKIRLLGKPNSYHNILALLSSKSSMLYLLIIKKGRPALNLGLYNMDFDAKELVLKIQSQ